MQGRQQQNYDAKARDRREAAAQGHSGVLAVDCDHSDIRNRAACPSRLPAVLRHSKYMDGQRMRAARSTPLYSFSSHISVRGGLARCNVDRTEGRQAGGSLGGQTRPWLTRSCESASWHRRMVMGFGAQRLAGWCDIGALTAEWLSFSGLFRAFRPPSGGIFCTTATYLQPLELVTGAIPAKGFQAIPVQLEQVWPHHHSTTPSDV